MEWGGGSPADRRRRVVVGIGVAAVVVGLIVVTRRDGDGNGDGDLAGPDTPSETVEDFFAAQATGDCPGLRELVTEASWSDGGRRSADEFLAQCEDALDGYRPAPGPGRQASVSSPPAGGDPPDEGDRLEVVSLDQPGQADRRGSLVREDGRWKVELDPVVLHIGRSPGEVVAGYVGAYNAGDCAAILGLLSERAWSRDGQRSSADFLAACTTRAEARRASDEAPVVLSQTTTTAQDAASATVAVRFGSPLAPVGDPLDSVRLVTEGLGWALDANTARPGAEPLLLELTYRDLQARLLDEVDVGGRTCTGTDEAAEAPGSIAGLRRTYFDCYVRVSLVQHAGPDEAAAAVDAVVADRLDVDDTAREVGVPGIAGATGIVGDCDPGACTEAAALQADGDTVVHVELQTSADIATAARVLQVQLER
jgi:hypothetical protein